MKETLYTIIIAYYDGKLCGIYLMPQLGGPDIWLEIYANKIMFMYPDSAYTFDDVQLTYKQLQEYYLYLETKFGIKPPFRELRGSLSIDERIQQMKDSCLIK